MALSLTSQNIRIDGENIAKFTRPDGLALMVRELIKGLKPSEALYLTLSVMGAARTSELSKFVGADNSNTGRRLERLAKEGRIYILRTDDKGERGRPSRVWAVAN